MTDFVSRRDFLQVTTGAGALARLGPALTEASDHDSEAGAQAPFTSAEPLSGWFDRPMRWAQLTLVENDPGRFDPQFWIDYFRRLRADADAGRGGPLFSN